MDEQRFATPQPVRLEVKIAAADLAIETVEGGESTVSLDGSPRALEAARVELIGDRLLIEQRRKSVLGMFGGAGEALHVRARIPRRSAVEIVTASGDATLQGSFGTLKMTSASGDASVTGELDGNTTVKTVSGGVRLPALAGNLVVQTVSGDVDAESVAGSVRMKSVSGGLRVGSMSEGDLVVHTVSGAVELGIAQGSKIDVDARSASGQLISEVPLTDTPGRGQGPTVVIRGSTVSGDFKILRAL